MDAPAMYAKNVQSPKATCHRHTAYWHSPLRVLSKHSELESTCQTHDIIWIHTRFDLLQSRHIISINPLQIFIVERIVRVHRRILDILSLRHRCRTDYGRRLDDRIVEDAIRKRVGPGVVDVVWEVADGAIGRVGGVGTVREDVGEEGLNVVRDEGAGVEGVL